jgi:DNA-binding MarR family transcriptional regulator
MNNIVDFITNCILRESIMTLEFLVISAVREVMYELIWGDRFERDLEKKMTSSKVSFTEIRDRLLEEDLVYQLKGEYGSPYLSLTDKGIAVINRLYEIERILEGENVDTE